MSLRPAALAALLCLLAAAPASALTLQSRFPLAGAAEVCPDAPLRLVFDGPVTLGGAGSVVIKDATGAVADTIEIASAAQVPGIGSNQSRDVGGVSLRYPPLVVDGDTLNIRPHVTLAYGHSYTVTIEPGVVAGADGSAWDEPADTWSFATRAAPPAGTDGTLAVAADGTADFCTVQGAIDYVREGHPGRVTILVRRGVYHELVNIPKGKDRITLRGEDRHQSVIACTNNAVLNPAHREMMGVRADDVVIENLTLHNLTPKGGRQAETLRVQADRCLLVDDDFASFQDTLRLDGRVYVKNCAIAGDVDFIWGGGTVYFEKCALDALNRGYLVQARNPASRLGYVFADCTIATEPGAAPVVLARIDPKIYPYSNVVFIRCRLGPGILPEGWELDLGTDRSQAQAAGGSAGGRTERSARVDNAQPAPHVRFWEYGSTDLSGQPIDTGRRLPYSRQLTTAELTPFVDAAAVLGGWVVEAP